MKGFPYLTKDYAVRFAAKAPGYEESL